MMGWPGDNSKFKGIGDIFAKHFGHIVSLGWRYQRLSVILS